MIGAVASKLGHRAYTQNAVADPRVPPGTFFWEGLCQPCIEGSICAGSSSRACKKSPLQVVPESIFQRRATFRIDIGPCTRVPLWSPAKYHEYSIRTVSRTEMQSLSRIFGIKCLHRWTLYGGLLQELAAFWEAAW